MMYLSLVSSWQPPAENPAAEPSLDYTDPLFRRRISQLSRMTVEVVHALFEKAPGLDRNTKIVFTSFRGELNMEFKINEQLIQDEMIKPASFSLSVFNTSPALATIACHLTGGYSAVYPVNDDFSAALKAAFAPVICGSEEKVIFIYGDEYIRDEYKTLGEFKDGSSNSEKHTRSLNMTPLAFAALVTRTPFDKSSVQFDETVLSKPEASSLTPEHFLSKLSHSKDTCTL